MADTDFLFEMDAGQLVAKLHRAACSTHPDCFYFNTGIINDQNVKPDDTKAFGLEAATDSISFDFDIKTDQYEVGCLFSKPIVINVQDVLKEYTSAMANADDSKDKKAASAKPVPSPKTAKKPEAEAAAHDKEGEKSSALDPAKPESDTDDGPESTSPVKESLRSLFEAELSAGNQVSAEQPTQVKPENMNIVDLVKRNDFIQVLDKVMKAAINNEKTKMAAPIFDYIKTFTGKSNLKAEDLAVTYLPPNIRSPYKIKKYQSTVLPYMEPAEVRKLIFEKLEKAKTLKELKTLEFDNICFKVGYSLHIAD